MLDTIAADLLQSDHPAPYMTFTFDMAEHWKPRVPEVVHEDGTARAQIVTEDTNPRLLRAPQRAGKSTRPRCLLEHIAQPPRRADGLLANRCAQHALRL